eukprot:CAMPEP_0202703136 /NCGR_PEP_ID=MMETSP1385-20130828/16020_1 /ASSEMBLY_ACC=CAM_ASM_000861 /TAXON_ID=933848 /ORGANISM="Elphidium margaritaceum" /LENGTH=244 /DNA_ID=CAMNT_0049360929 /DNA_START=66 /DNA_END=800 /DNA_ORIENTATION=-
MAFSIIEIPTIIAIPLNLWFHGQYTVQMQVPIAIRSRYPKDRFAISLFSPNDDLGYTVEAMTELIVEALVVPFVLDLVYVALIFGYLRYWSTKCLREFYCADVIIALPLYISAALKIFYQRKLCSNFVGIHQVNEDVVVSVDTPGIMLSVFGDWSFLLYSLSAAFTLFFALSLLLSKCGRVCLKTKIYGSAGHNYQYIRQRNRSDDTDTLDEDLMASPKTERLKKSKKNADRESQAFGGFSENS